VNNPENKFLSKLLQVLPGSDDLHKVNTLDQIENNKVLDALSGGKYYPN
jgi:hypothetical protein